MKSAVQFYTLVRQISFVLFVSLVAAGTARGAIRFWRNNAGSGNWNDAAKWSSLSAADTNAANNGAPAGGDQVRIDNTDGAAHAVTFNAATISLSSLTIDLIGAGSAVNTLTNSTANSITAGYIGVGGFDGIGETNGRGKLIQSNGTIATTPGLDMVIGWGAGSTGTYELSGAGIVNAYQSIFVGSKGNGTFTQSGGTVNLPASAVGYLNIGAISGSSGTYSQSAGTLSVAKFEYVGDGGTGVFNQMGGMNTITGAGNGLLLGNAATGVGTYTASGTAELTVPGDVTVGLNGSGTFNVQGNAKVNITGGLKIGAGDAVNLSGGTLRFNDYTRNPTGTFNFTGGTVKLAATQFDRAFNFDSTIIDLYGANSNIANGRNLTLEGKSSIGKDALGTVTVSNAVLTTQNDLTVGWEDHNGTLNIINGSTVNSAKVIVGDNQHSSSDFPQGIVNVSQAIWNTGWLILGNTGKAALNITNGGYVVSSDVSMGFDDGINENRALDTAVVSGPGSTWISNDSLSVGGIARAKLTIENGGTVYVNNELTVWLGSNIDMNGGTLRFGTLDLAGLSSGLANAGKLNYNGGTLQFAGSRNVGTDADIQRFYGTLPVIPTGKGLTVENTLTLSAPLHLDGGSLKTFILNITTGSLNFAGGTFELTGGPVTGLNSLAVPTGGEFRAVGAYSFRVTGAADSVITATGNLTIGNSAAINGFYTDGTLTVGASTVTLNDANDAVVDSGALVSIGSGTSPGTLAAANGLTLDFGGNIAGFGAVTTPNNIAKPLINNGHITGASAAQKITLPGYVKGVGTFDNVSFTGTFSPGLSPTSLQVGSIALSDASTLVMELGGTSPGSGYDQIQSAGQITFDGTLQLALINGFTLAAGQSFNLFDWLTTAGSFDVLQLPTIAGLAWNTSQLYTTGVVSIAAAGLPGDYNQNGIVNAADYTVWRNNLGSPTPLANDDTPGVGPDDYTRWKTHFGEVAGAGSREDASAAVPEPTAALILVVGMLMFEFVTRRGKQRQINIERALMIGWITRLGLGVIMAAALLSATVATAAVKDWTDGTGNWSTPANWSGGTVPVGGDLVNLYFTDGVARTVTYNIPAIALGSMNVSLKGAGAANATLSMAANSLAVGTEYVGYDGRGTINQSGGTNTISADTGSLDIGVLAGSTGTYNLSGTGALVANATEYVGDAGTGIFNQSGGTNAVFAGDLILGSQALSTGTYTLSGGSLSTEGFQFIGEFGNGTISQTGGTNIGGIFFLGFRTGSSGTYTLSAGEASFSQPFVGGNTGSPGGTGVLTVSGTGVLNVSIGLKVHNAAGTSLNLSGGTINTAALNFSGNPAVFNWTSGKLNLTSDVTWDSAAEASSTSAAFGAARTLGTNQTLMVTGNEALGDVGAFALTLNSGSTHNVTGGLTVNPAGSITVNPGSTLTYTTFTQAGGMVNGTLQNQTTFNYQSGLFNGRLVNQGIFNFGSSFTAGNGVESDTTMTLAAGQTLTTNGAGLDNRSPFTIASGGNLIATSVVNQSEFIVNGSATATTFTNTALLHGIGQVTAAVTNAASGDVRIVAGERLRFAGASFANQGLVEAIGVTTNLAEVEFNSTVINETANGLIAGSNSLYRFNSGLTNQASFALSIGTNNVFGDVTNSATGNIVVSGGAGATFYDDIVQNGTFRVSKVGLTSSVAVVFGAFSGSGGSTGGGDIFFEGDLRPGNSPASVTFDNSVSFGSGANLTIELGGTTPGTGHDQIIVTGDLALGGTLEVSILPSLTPAAGQTFNILDWFGTRTGSFSALNLPTLAGLVWNTSQLYTNGVISLAAGLAGDYNQNGTVDAADYTVWRNHLGTSFSLPNETASLGTVDGEDYAVWKSNFGSGSGAGSIAGQGVNSTVPEPSSFIALVIAALLVASTGSQRYARSPGTRWAGTTPVSF